MKKRRIYPERSRRVAIFDIDGTIFRSSLLIELVEALIEAKIFPAKARKLYAKSHRAWLDRQAGYDPYINRVIKAFDQNIKGVRRRDFAKVARRVAGLHKNRVYRYTRALIQDLKKKRYYLLAISRSPTYVVRAFGRKLGFDKVYGTFFEVHEDNRFTGKVLHLDIIKDKARVLYRAVEKERLTLQGSVGVGDSESDIPFLKLVERPICFNPSSKLYRIARRNKWPVVVERKDVIYRL